MGLSFVQTDTTAPAGGITACSGKTVSSTVAARLCTEGGTAGESVATSGPRVDRASAMFEISPGANVDWLAGTISVPFNVTSANANVTWSGCYVCRLNSSNVSRATMGSTTGIADTLSSTGVRTVNVTVSAQPTAAATDKVYIVLTFTTPASTENFGWIPNQTITTPFLASNPGSVAVSRMHAMDMMVNNLGRHRV